MFFKSDKQEASDKKGPLEPAKQRNIPKVKQAKPRAVLSSDEKKEEQLKQELPFQSTEMATDERTTPPVQEVQQSMSMRDDAVDVQLQDHTKEVDNDTKTNPVEQNKKRVLRNEDDVNFLQNDSTAEPSKFGQKFQDEEFMRNAKEALPPGADQDMANEDDEEEFDPRDIEHASDDEPGDEEQNNYTNRIGRKKRLIDDDYEEKEGIEEEESEEVPMDDLEAEHISDEEDSNKKKNDKESKGWTRKHRTEISEANLEGDEEEATVFIDNLPNDEINIKAMIRQVKYHVKELEKQFFEEEDSDNEEEEKQTEDATQNQDNVVPSEST